MSGKEEGAVKLTKDTYIPIGVAAVLFMSLMYGSVWLNSRLQQLDFALLSLKKDVKALSAKMDYSMDDRWRASDMKNWTEILKAKNKDLDVPEPFVTRIGGK